jgi:hypothetical protein
MKEIQYYTVSDGSRFVLIKNNGKVTIGMRSKTKLTRRRRKAIAMICGLTLRDFPSQGWPNVKYRKTISINLINYLAQEISNSQ